MCKEQRVVELQTKNTIRLVVRPEEGKLLREGRRAGIDSLKQTARKFHHEELLSTLAGSSIWTFDTIE